LSKFNALLTCTAAIAALGVLFFSNLFFPLWTWTSGGPVAGEGLPQVAQGTHPPSAEPAGGDAPSPEDLPFFAGNINSLPRETIVELLAFLDTPIANARINMTAGQLPGAPRPYRNGIHEGIDFYDGFSGVPIIQGTPVLAAAEGKIIRIDHAYQEMTPAQADEFRRISAESLDTPADILDKFRGRQVWLEHQGEVITRYAHLETVEAGLVEGQIVSAGQQIGTVGNSGTSQAVAGRRGGRHLHFEVWLKGYYLGEGLPLEDIRFILRGIFE